MKNIKKRKIQASVMQNVQKAEKKILKRAKKDMFYAKAMVGASLVASLIGAGVYLWQRRSAEKKVDFKRVKVQIINDIKKASKNVSAKMKKMSDRK